MPLIKQIHTWLDRVVSESDRPFTPDPAHLSPAPMPELNREGVETSLQARMAAGPLLTLRMDLINKCNLRCIMCHYSDPNISRRKAITVTTEQFASWFAPIGGQLREIMLSCGDEPLMSRHFSDILEVASGFPTNADIGFCTNAMLMTSKIRSAIIRNRVTFIMFSVDGATKETFERIRAGSRFETVFGNIKALKRLKDAAGLGRPRFILNFVMMRSNIHEAVRMVEIASNLGAAWVDFRHAVSSPPYWTDTGEMLPHFPEEYNFYRAKVVAKAAELDVTVVMPDAYPTAKTFASDLAERVDLAPYHAIEPDPEEADVAIPRAPVAGVQPPMALELPREFFGSAFCERPFTEVLIRNQREVLPCAWHQNVLGVLDEKTTIREIFLGEKFANLRLKMMRWEKDDGCLGCPIKSDLLPTRIANKESGSAS